ncbi:MAG: nucleoside phosphorylase [Flavobacteriales bacterium]
MSERFSESELILRPDSTVYHLGVRGEDIADRVIIVGDPERVALISERFDAVRFRVASREFCIHTGVLNGIELTVISTGIGVDNIDIVINELDAAVNIDPISRTVNAKLRKLKFLRLGTSGALNSSIDIHSVVCSEAAIGMDGVPHFYNVPYEPQELKMVEAFKSHTHWSEKLAEPYAVLASKSLLDQFNDVFDYKGITITANGFYGPQNRQLRGRLSFPDLESRYQTFKLNHMAVTNFEMETSGIYALSKMLGHEHLTLCVILANRIKKQFSKSPEKAVSHLIDKALNTLTI